MVPDRTAGCDPRGRCAAPVHAPARALHRQRQLRTGNGPHATRPGFAQARRRSLVDSRAL